MQFYEGKMVRLSVTSLFLSAQKNLAKEAFTEAVVQVNHECITDRNNSTLTKTTDNYDSER